MNVNRPISELAELLARRQPIAPEELLRDIALELELLIGRHQTEGSSQALRGSEEDAELQ